MVKVKLKKTYKRPPKKRGQKKLKKKTRAFGGHKKTPSWKKKANLKKEKKGGHALHFQNEIFGALLLFLPSYIELAHFHKQGSKIG